MPQYTFFAACPSDGPSRWARIVCVPLAATAVVAASLAVGSAGAAADDPCPSAPLGIEGSVTSPVLGVYDPGKPTAATFTFSGSVNVPPEDWHIAVETLRSANADPGKEENWERVVETFRATGGGPEEFTFSVDDVAPFKGLPDAWKSGGLGRVRVRVVANADPKQCKLLSVQDSDGLVPANATTLIFADANPTPKKPPRETPASIKNERNPRTPNYITANTHALWFTPDEGSLQDREAQIYYDTVKVGSTGLGDSIQVALPTLKKFIDHYFRPFECQSADNEDEVVTRYFNRGDLGIGRRMHCINRGCTGELACYVENFGKPNGNAIFNDQDQAKQALLADRPFATVAMVERRRSITLANSLFFVVYGATTGSSDPQFTEILHKAPLDNKGYNSSIPGNCMQCHGINSSLRLPGHKPEVAFAKFLPFDLDAFGYFATGADPLSRQRQEPDFRALNRIISKAFSISSNTRRLIRTWYDFDLDHGTFNGNAIPEGWADEAPEKVPIANQEQLYRKLVAPYCRSCHISYDTSSQAPDNRPQLAFTSFTNFVALAAPKICSSGHKSLAFDFQGRRRGAESGMPAAEQTLKLLWRSEGRAHLFAQVPGAFGDCGL